MMKKFLILLFFAFNFYALAQNVSFTTSVNRNQVQQGERIQVTFSLNNAQGTDFKPPKFKGFSVLQGPMTSQSTQIINGNYSFSVSYVFLLQADVEGKHTIDPATVNAGGKKLNSNPITITVSKGAPKQQNSGNQDNQNFNKQAGDLVKKHIFIRVSTSKQNVYQGEQLVATYKLYVHPDMYQGANLSPSKMPNLNGFWSNDLIELNAQNQSASRENVDGVNYIVREIKKVLLIPLESGNLTLDPLELDAKVGFTVPKQKKSNSRDPFEALFDDPFFNPREVREYKTEVKSKPLTITVKPLPDNKPADFNGAVGDLQMKATLDKGQTTQNQPVTLKITISGNGNLKLLQPLPLKLPQDIEMYEPKTNDNIQYSPNGMSGSRTFEYLLIPRNPGEYKLDPIKFSYFDISQKAFKTISSEEFVIKVDKGSGEAVNISGVNKQDIKYLGKDIRFIKNEFGTSISKNGGYYNSILYYILINLAFSLCLGGLIYRKKLDEIYGNKSALLNRKASKTAHKRLSIAKKYLNEKNEDKFYEEVSKALWDYISHKLNIPTSDLTKDVAELSLQKRNVDGLIINKLNSTIDFCEFARFAPNAEKMSMNDVFDSAAGVITELEGRLK
jgi:hypothetical protein